jgi:23S rRNA (cytosine1962-C5)-methyltransferase
MKSVTLKHGREKSVLARHPWLFSGAIADSRGNPASGDTVAVFSAKGDCLGSGAFSPASKIRVRMWTFDPDENVAEDLIVRRLTSAVALRERLGLAAVTDALRLVNAEADGLPGLIVDRYAETAVCQFLSAGAERWKPTVIEWLAAQHGLQTVYERSDTDARTKEGLEHAAGTRHGPEPPPQIRVSEYDTTLLVDVRQGHKTGMYLDQRENRRAIIPWCDGKDVLNCFSYTGTFALAALRGGARHVTNVDVSADALELARQQARLNNVDEQALSFVQGDVFRQLRTFRDARVQFDTIVLDPPKFADSRAQVPGACRGYKDINLLALKLLTPGGSLFTFSCSGSVDAELFQKVVAGAAADAGRDPRILRHLEQAPDHPVALTFPEGAYLKGLHLVV